MGALPVDCEAYAVSPILKTTGLSMNKPPDVAPDQAVELGFGGVGRGRVGLHPPDRGSLLDELRGRTATAPHFFERTAVCLDISPLANPLSGEEIRAVMDVVRRAGMLSVGLAQGGASI